MSVIQCGSERCAERMSLNNESSRSSDDESFQSSRSIVCSSGRSWSRSSSMSSGISAISTTSSESMRELKAKFGPITRPTPTEPPRPSSDPWRDSPVSPVQQQNSQDSRTNPEQTKSDKKSFLPVAPKIVRPVTNMPQPQAWVTYSGPVYGPPMQHFPHPMMYHPAPTVQWPMTYPMPVPPVPMQPPVGLPIYSRPQARLVSVQMQYTYAWTYIDYCA